MYPDAIRVRIWIRVEYENTYDISDIRPYPIRFHREIGVMVVVDDVLQEGLVGVITIGS
jgi:hypothetical protein